MTKARGRQQNAKSIVDMSTPSLVSEVWAPDPAECIPEQYILPLFGSHDAVSVRTLTDDANQLVEFAVVQLARLDDEDDWREVVKVDCAHGQVHVHRFDSAGTELSNKPFCSIEGPESVTAGYEHAQTVIFDRWEENRRRWDYGK